METAATMSAPADDDLLTMLHDSAQDFCTRALDRSRLRALRGGTPPFDRACWNEMAELGWLGVMLPEDHNGLGVGTRGAATLARALGAVAAPEPLIETAVAAAIVLDRSAAGQPLSDALIDGERIMIAALGALGEDPFAALDAADDGAGTNLTGTLNAVPLGADADALLVPANLDGVPVWCLLDSTAAGVDITPRPLADGSRDARLVLTQAPATLLTRGDVARDVHAAARVAAELAASAYQLGLADTLLAMTLDYVATRRQFGKAIGSFQVLQHRLVDAYLALRLADAVVGDCCATIDAGATGDAALRAASRAGERSGASLALIAREAIQIHGAIGYTDECDVGVFVNRGLVVAARYGRADAHAARCRQLTAIAPSVDVYRDGERSLADHEPPNGDWNALDNETFRQIVRQWHCANYPPELRNLRYRAR